VRCSQLDGPEPEPVSLLVANVLPQTCSGVVERRTGRAVPRLLGVTRDRVPRVEVVESRRPQ
jgi:hypothetical protein